MQKKNSKKLISFSKAAKGIPLLFFPIISIFERFFLEKKIKNKLIQPVFIIGAPRTGSTILYQALTNYTNVVYIDNLVCRWHRNLLFGFWLADKKKGDRAHNNFEADHGNTKRFGFSAPSECGAFWYRWLPKDSHFVDYDKITRKMIIQIQSEIISVISYFEKPLVFKNLNAGQRLRLISLAFPQAKFIYIKRDPRFVIRSILKARRTNDIRPNQWWSIMPPDYKKLLSLPESSMVAAQLYSIEQQIEKDLKLFPGENIKEIHFQSLSKNTIDEIAQWIGAESRELGSLPIFKKDSIKNITIEELELLTSFSNEFSFSKEQYIYE